MYEDVGEPDLAEADKEETTVNFAVAEEAPFLLWPDKPASAAPLSAETENSVEQFRHDDTVDSAAAGLAQMDTFFPGLDDVIANHIHRAESEEGHGEELSAGGGGVGGTEENTVVGERGGKVLDDVNTQSAAAAQPDVDKQTTLHSPEVL